ncbi:MAG: hypothetical protein Q9195_003837 [Heterodermia aff. obscurata]
MTSRSESAEDRSETGSVGLSDLGDSIDIATFEQILEMDDDEEEREFSKGIVFGFFDQAEQTFEGMDKALASQDLNELSSLGHFLKGSSATLGLTRVKDSCEKIQHYGARKDERGDDTNKTDSQILELIALTVVEVKKEYKEAEKVLRRFYQD